MAAFSPYRIEGIPLEEQFMSWDTMVQAPYDKYDVDAYSRTRVILMNGIETNSVLTSHALARMLDDADIVRRLAQIRRVDSQQQETVDWLNPADQSVLETTIGYEQVAVDLTANLARNEPDAYFRQVLNFALLEDFDHLYRYANLLELLEGKEAARITQGKTDIKPGRATQLEHRHPDDELRKWFDAMSASLKTHMNYHTIVSGEQQTMLFYRTHGNMYADDLARKLYAEIAEIEEQHVSQYEMAGDPRLSPLHRMTMIQLMEAYNYYSCLVTEPDPRLRSLWERFCAMEVEHFNVCNWMMRQYENRDFRDLHPDEWIEPLVVFEPNKEYVDHVLATEVELEPYQMNFVNYQQLPADWASHRYRAQVNAGMVPSEEVVRRADARRMRRAA